MQTMHVLLVEPDQALAEVLCDFLRDERHVVVHADDLDQARALMRTSTWDVCVVEPAGASYVDVSLAQAEELRRIAGESPVVVITGRSWAQRTEPSDLGVHAIVSKPFDLDRLLCVLESAAGS